jgi:hypothetical protein
MKRRTSIVKKIEGIILEGEKLGVEKTSGKDNKLVVNFHLLSGFTSLKVRVADQNLTKVLDDFPVRKPIKLKADVMTFKDELYLSAVAVVG